MFGTWRGLGNALEDETHVVLVLWAQKVITLSAVPWLSIFAWFPKGTLMHAHCHLTRKPLHLRDTVLHRRPLGSHSLAGTLIPGFQGLMVLLSGTGALTYVGTDTLLLRFLDTRRIRTSLKQNFLILKKLIPLV